MRKPFTISLTVTLAGILAVLLIAATPATPYRWEQEVSGTVINTTTVAQTLGVPNSATHARIYVEGNPVCWDAAAVPTTAGPGEWPAGYMAKEQNDGPFLRDLKVISCAEGSATIHIVWTRNRQ